MAHSEILIIAAVPGETAHLISQAHKIDTDTVGGRPLMEAELRGIPVKILTTGPGPVNTAQALTAAIEQSRPKVVVQIGCAGAFKQSGLSLGDIAVAIEEIDVQLGIESPSEAAGVTPLPFSILNNETETFSNRFPLASDWADALIRSIDQALRHRKIFVKKGVFTTASTVTASKKTANKRHQAYSACMESMEGASAAHICLHYQIPFVEIRAASNIVGERNKNKWNLELSFENCNLALMACIDQIHSMITTE